MVKESTLRDVHRCECPICRENARGGVATEHREINRLLAVSNERLLLIEVDSGGANDYRKWEWKVALQQLADEFQLTITVTHFPPGASKWNPIEHRMFSLISGNWAGEPLTSYEAMLKHVRTTRSTAGFHCRACLDCGQYSPQRRVTEEQKNFVRPKRRRVLPNWNYTIFPHERKPD